MYDLLSKTIQLETAIEKRAFVKKLRELYRRFDNDVNSLYDKYKLRGTNEHWIFGGCVHDGHTVLNGLELFVSSSDEELQALKHFRHRAQHAILLTNEILEILNRENTP